MALDYKPNADKVLVRPAAAEEKTKSGIIIPDTAKEKPQTGEIVAVGEGKYSPQGVLIPTQRQIGETVYYGKYAGTEITLDGIDYLIIKEEDILLIKK